MPVIIPRTEELAADRVTESYNARNAVPALSREKHVAHGGAGIDVLAP